MLTGESLQCFLAISELLISHATNLYYHQSCPATVLISLNQSQQRHPKTNSSCFSTSIICLTRFFSLLCAFLRCSAFWCCSCCTVTASLANCRAAWRRSWFSRRCSCLVSEASMPRLMGRSPSSWKMGSNILICTAPSSWKFDLDDWRFLITETQHFLKWSNLGWRTCTSKNITKNLKAQVMPSFKESQWLHSICHGFVDDLHCLVDGWNFGQTAETGPHDGL